MRTHADDKDQMNAPHADHMTGEMHGVWLCHAAQSGDTPRRGDLIEWRQKDSAADIDECEQLGEDRRHAHREETRTTTPPQRERRQEEPAKGFTDTFEGMPLDDDEEERWPAGGHPIPMADAAPTTAVPPPAAEEADWSRVAQMFETNNRQQERILTDTLVALRVAIDEETTKMNKLAAKIDGNIDEVNRNVVSVTERLTALENKQQHEAAKEHEPTLIGPTYGRARSDGWVQGSIIFGGWPEMRTESRKLEYVNAALRAATVSEADHLRPVAPQRSSIVKVKCRDVGTAPMALFGVMQALNKMKQPGGETGKVWAAAEWPPEENDKRKVLRDATAEIQAMGPNMDRLVIQWGAAEVVQNGRVVLRGQNGRMQAAEAWGSSPPKAGRSWAPRAMTRC